MKTATAPSLQVRAYDTTTEWSGPVRSSIGEAWDDAEAHNEGCRTQGGYGSAIVVRRDPEAPSRLVYADGENVGESVWPPHGRSNGAARWR